MKRRIFAGAIIVICLAIITSSTIAYFTAKGIAKNVITTGDVDIKVIEYQDKDGELVPYPKDSVDIMPGEEISKIATVMNNDAESYIRAKIVVLLKDSDGKVLKEVGINEFNDITLDINSSYWSKKSDNDEWWYYNKSLLTNEAAEPLFTKVIFNGGSMTNEYKNTMLDVKVLAQGVQSVNNGDNALEANGWPSNN